jgi:hypothetical protein
MLLLLALLACVPQASDPKDTGPEDLDRDDDGYEKDVDCDDRDPAVHPDATERCDDADVDEDCNGVADQYDSGALGGITVYQDADGDGYGADDHEHVTRLNNRRQAKRVRPRMRQSGHTRASSEFLANVPTCGQCKRRPRGNCPTPAAPEGPPSE